MRQSLNHRFPPFPRTPSPLQGKAHPANGPEIPQGEVRWSGRGLRPVPLWSPTRGGVRQGKGHHSTKLALAGASWVLPLPCCLDFSKSFNLPESLSALKQKFCPNHNSFYLITNFKKHFTIHALQKSIYSEGPHSRPGPVASGLRRVHIIRKALAPQAWRCCLKL